MKDKKYSRNVHLKFIRKMSHYRFCLNEKQKRLRLLTKQHVINDTNKMHQPIIVKGNSICCFRTLLDAV